MRVKPGDVNVDTTSAPALVMALKNRDYESFKLLLEHGASIATRYPYFSPMATFAYAQKTPTDIFQLLIKHGVSVNERSSYPHTPPISLATSNLGMCTALIEAGADLSIPDAAGELPLHYASRVCNTSFRLVFFFFFLTRSQINQ